MIRSLLAAALTLTGVLAISPTAPQVVALDDTPWTLPEPPRRCTTAEADSGDVGHCLVISYRDPSDVGWGYAPAPGVGSGWDWQGYTYNGSPALSGWESTYIVANSEPVPGFSTGTLRTHRHAQALFEGFLTEVSENGYRIRGGNAYTFRCTSGNGGWDCPSGDPDDLSNHAWGIALDINAGTNPIRSYYGEDGETACKTPMQTDMPKWVIQTAERWGLYWGGYGWSSGCQTVDTERTRVYRDPPHFEFRGTPEQARAIADFNFRNDPRTTCWMTVSDAGEDVERCNTTGKPEAGWRLPVSVDAPEGAAAALVNLTAVDPSAGGYLTLEHCGPVSGERTTSSVNFAARETAAAMAIVPLDEGRFCVYRHVDAHTVVDAAGYLTDTGERLWYQPSDPDRRLDTRFDEICDDDGCTIRPIGGSSRRVVPFDERAPRIVNLTVVDALGSGHARVGSCDEIDTANVSNVNYVSGSTRANLALFPDGPEGSCVWTHRTTDVIVDEFGRLDPDDGMGWTIRPSERVLDTRLCTDDWCEGRPVGGEAFELELGVTSPGAAVTLTITDAAASGYAWIGACDELVDGVPTTSNVNYVPGKATANMAMVSPDDGTVCVFVHADTHVVVDLLAELTDDRTFGLAPVAPNRLHDSRPEER